MTLSTRRTFLRGSAALVTSSAILRSARASAPTPAATLRRTSLNQFAYAQVQLGPGPMLDQFRRNHELFLNLSEDSLLKPFRQAAGLPAPGDDMGGWYTPSPLFDPPRNMTGYIPGHSFGQYLSGLSRAYAVTGHAPTQAKVHRLVAAFAPTVTPKFYEGYCIPAYTFDKTNCGLIDAHAFAADPRAMATLATATDAALPWLPEKALDREEMLARPHKTIAFTWDETYTLPENFYLAFRRGGGPRYHALAQRYLQDDTYFNALAENRNVLPGLHAYSHVNALCSALQSYLTDGSEKHLRAATNGFQMVLDQSFATGGWGPNEGFQKPGNDGLLNTLKSTHNSFETPCGAYGHFKVARYLMRITGRSTYGDSMEAVLYNTILGARPIQPDGVSFYYADYNHDAHKVDYEQKWPCCSGTFPQLTADYGISSYLHDPHGIYVNLYVPSEVTWKQAGAIVKLSQTTTYPTTGDTTLAITTDRSADFDVALRIPAWAGPGTTVRINGKLSGIAAQPGAWARIHRTWHAGDHIELSLDMPLRLVPLDPAHTDVVALLRGPVALFAIGPGTAPITRSALLSAQQVGSSADFRITGASGPILFRPYTSITTEHYRLYHSV